MFLFGFGDSVTLITIVSLFFRLLWVNFRSFKGSTLNLPANFPILLLVGLPSLSLFGTT